MKVDIETKFNVGDFVATKEAVLRHKMTRKHWDKSIPIALQIIEVVIQYCYANCVQVHYRLRAYSRDGGSTLWDMTEPELELYREEDYVAVTKESDQPSK
jgi:hypothetical protein